MRRLVLKMSMSADGFVGGPEGGGSWLFPSLDYQATAWLVETLWDAGIHLMGRKTYHAMAAHWPRSDEPFAAPMNGIPKIVFSKTLTAPAWVDTTVRSGDLATEVNRLKRQPGKDLLAHGGAGFAQALVKEQLVDEYRIVVHPVVLGGGLKLFPPAAHGRTLKLVSSTPFPGGAIANVYHPAA